MGGITENSPSSSVKIIREAVLWARNESEGGKQALKLLSLQALCAPHIGIAVIAAVHPFLLKQELSRDLSDGITSPFLQTPNSNIIPYSPSHIALAAQ